MWIMLKFMWPLKMFLRHCFRLQCYLIGFFFFLAHVQIPKNLLQLYKKEAMSRLMSRCGSHTFSISNTVKESLKMDIHDQSAAHLKVSSINNQRAPLLFSLGYSVPFIITGLKF